jgi:hypothetical protein
MIEIIPKEKPKVVFRGKVRIFWIPQVKLDGTEGNLVKFMQVDNGEKIWYEPYSPLMLSYYSFVKKYHIEDLTFGKSSPPSDIEEVIERGIVRYE